MSDLNCLGNAAPTPKNSLKQDSFRLLILLSFLVGIIVLMIIDSLFFKPQIKKASIQLNPIDFTASGIQKYLKKNLKEDISEEIKKVEVNKRKGSVKVFFQENTLENRDLAFINGCFFANKAFEKLFRLSEVNEVTIVIITNFEDTSENEIWKPAIKIKIDAGRARKIKWELFEHHEIIESGDLPETIDYGVYVLKIAKEVWVNPSITLRLRDERIKKILRYRELTYKESFEPILNDFAISEAKAYLNEIFRHDKGNPQITEAKTNKSKVFLRILLQREIEHADSIVRDACLLANESLEKFFKIRGVNEVQILFENKIANFYGKERKESAIRIEVAKEQVEKVTWEHFKFGPDILAIAKEVWISPVIRKSLTDKEIIRILNEKVKFKKP